MISNLWIIGFGISALIVVVVVILLAGIIFQTKRRFVYCKTCSL